MQGTFPVHEKKFVNQVKEEQALKVLAYNNTSISNRLVDQGRGSGSSKGGRGNRDERRQYHNYKNDNDPSNFQGKGKGHDQGFDKFKEGATDVTNLAAISLNVIPSCPKTKRSGIIEFFLVQRRRNLVDHIP